MWPNTSDSSMTPEGSWYWTMLWWCSCGNESWVRHTRPHVNFYAMLHKTTFKSVTATVLKATNEQRENFNMKVYEIHITMLNCENNVRGSTALSDFYWMFYLAPQMSLRFHWTLTMAKLIILVNWTPYLQRSTWELVRKELVERFQIW